MSHKVVPVASNISQQQAMRIGSYGSLVWLWDPGIQWVDGTLHFSVSTVRIIRNPVHSQADTQRIAESLTIWQGRLLLRIGAIHGVLCAGTIELLRQGGPILDHHIYYGRELRERRLWYKHARQTIMTKVLQGWHDNFLLRWAWDPTITIFSSSTIRRAEMVSTGEGHRDLPSGLCDSLMVWGTSILWQGDQQEEIRGSSCRRGFNPIGFGSQLWIATSRVYSSVDLECHPRGVTCYLWSYFGARTRSLLPLLHSTWTLEENSHFLGEPAVDQLNYWNFQG